MRIAQSRIFIRMSSRALVAMLVVICGVAAANSGPRTVPSAVWLTQAGDAKVLVRQCGAAICGKIVWLKQPIDTTTGQPQKDDKNRDLSLRARPIVGVQLFIDMRPSATNSWSGRIYNADDGHTYASTVTLLDAGRLEVKGCSGTLCGGETWTKVAH